jgi:hypothetical protein
MKSLVVRDVRLIVLGGFALLALFIASNEIAKQGNALEIEGTVPSRLKPFLIKFSHRIAQNHNRFRWTQL